MKPIIYPYIMGSESAKQLAKALSTKRVYPDKKYKPNQDHIIINWGNTTTPMWVKEGQLWLNYPQFVKDAANKLRTFEILKEAGVNIPEFCTKKEDVVQDKNSEDLQWLARTLLSSHSGKGIVKITGTGEIVDAPLYTKYIKKASEYRVHVFLGEVIDVVQKKKRSDLEKEDVDFQIRSWNNGWVFCREGIEVEEECRQQAINAVESLNLHFGAVDIIYNSMHDKYYVVEVNTAPGLVGSTISSYAETIKKVIGDD